MRIPLSNADVGDAERAGVAAALAHGWVSGTGPQITEFEARLSERVDRDHVIATANGTLALELALRALDIGPGDEVIVPALTFAAPAASVLAVSATLVLAEIDPDTWTLSPAEVSRKVTPRTGAVIAVDVLGHPCEYDALADLGLPVIEDAAEAHGASYKGRPAGSFGAISTFSFHANKTITTGEGGCVATDSEKLADKMRLIANHGMRPSRPYVHEVVGRNFRMTNLAAAVGVAQVGRWDELTAARNRIARLYDEILAGTGCTPRPVAPWARYGCWLHTVTVPDRDTVVERVRRAGIDVRALWPALSTQRVFNSCGTSFPVAEAVSRDAVWLPTASTMTDGDVEEVALAVAAAVLG